MSPRVPQKVPGGTPSTPRQLQAIAGAEPVRGRAGDLVTAIDGFRWLVRGGGCLGGDIAGVDIAGGDIAGGDIAGGVGAGGLALLE